MLVLFKKIWYSKTAIKTNKCMDFAQFNLSWDSLSIIKCSLISAPFMHMCTLFDRHYNAIYASLNDDEQEIK